MYVLAAFFRRPVFELTDMPIAEFRRWQELLTESADAAKDAGKEAAIYDGSR